jgi:hypothetical protein
LRRLPPRDPRKAARIVRLVAAVAFAVVFAPVLALTLADHFEARRIARRRRSAFGRSSRSRRRS